MLSSATVRLDPARFGPRHDFPPGGWVALAPRFVADDAVVMERLVATLPLRAERLVILGREVETPRLTSWHGDAGTSYRYSGRTFEPRPWTDELAAIRDAIDGATGVRFGSVLVNLYRDGRDSMGFHADDEPELGPSAPDDVLVASVSLGARRRFVLAEKNGSERRSLELGGGDLLVMGGALQRHWRHGVPKTKREVGPRMNLTFRLVRPRGG